MYLTLCLSAPQHHAPCSTYHNAEGTPVINAGKFPDMVNMTTWAHTLGLTAGWYG